MKTGLLAALLLMIHVAQGEELGDGSKETNVENELCKIKSEELKGLYTNLDGLNKAITKMIQNNDDIVVKANTVDQTDTIDQIDAFNQTNTIDQIDTIDNDNDTAFSENNTIDEMQYFLPPRILDTNFPQEFCTNYTRSVSVISQNMIEMFQYLQFTKQFGLAEFEKINNPLWFIGEMIEKIEKNFETLSDFNQDFDLGEDDFQSSWQMQFQIVCNKTMDIFQTSLNYLKVTDFHQFHPILFAESQAEEQSKIKKAVTNLYSKDKRNTKEVLSFAEYSPNLSVSVTIYESLYEEMSRNNQLQSHETLTFHDHLKRFSETKTLDPFLKSKVWSLKEKLQPLKYNISLNLNTQILAGKFDNLYDYTRDNYKYAHFYDNHLSVIIKRAYVNNFNNFDNILNLVSGLPNRLDFSNGFSYLLNELKTKNQMGSSEAITLGYKLQEVSEKHFEWTSIWENLKSLLPSSVRHLTRNSKSCTVKNSYWSEYLYASTLNAAWGSRRRVLTWIPGGSVTEGNWEFIHLGNSFFHIRNRLWNDYLAVLYPSRLYDENRRAVITYPVGQTAEEGKADTPWQIKRLVDSSKYVYGFQYLWKLEPRDDKMLIKHAIYDEYLYAGTGELDHERRYVFTWTKKNEIDEAKWLINCN